MKRLLLLAVVLCAYNVVQAQQDKDTVSYPGWWGYYYTPLDTFATIYDTSGSSLAVASPGYYEYLQFEVIQPLHIYGIAVTPSKKGPTFYRTFANGNVQPDPPGVDSSALNLYAVLVQKEGDRFVQVDSVKWHRREPDRYFRYTARHPMPSALELPEAVVPVYEFYFDTPHYVHDSFYLGFKSDYVMSPIFDSTVCTPDHYPQQWAFDVCFMSNGSAGAPIYRTWYMPRWGKLHHFWVSTEDDPLLVGTPFWGGIFPIIVPPDTDAVTSIPVRGFHRTDDYDGWPAFVWNETTGQELYELAYGRADQAPSGYRSIFTSYPWLILRDSTLDSTVVYAAHCRARHHHACAIHDTVVWSGWTDTVEFYTGKYRPGSLPDDNVGVVSPKGALSFTLSPNPARDEVTVTAESADGYGCWLTLRDEAGRELLRRQMGTYPGSSSHPSQEGTSSLTLSTRGLVAGLYFVTLESPKGTSTQKLVVER
jgi:hypothetical protein